MRKNGDQIDKDLKKSQKKNETSDAKDLRKVDKIYAIIKDYFTNYTKNTILLQGNEML